MDSHEIREVRSIAMSKLDLSGRQFGTLYIESRIGAVTGDDGDEHYVYQCKCDCGVCLEISDECIRPFVSNDTGNLRSDSNVGRNLEDLTGRHFHRWHVMYRACSKKEPSGRYATVWHCHCSCGTHKMIKAGSLKGNTSFSCGCYKLEQLSLNRDLTDQYFGRWHVLGLGKPFISPANGRKYRTWQCRCECGTVRDVSEPALVSKKSISCGCYRKEQHAKSVVYEDLSGRCFGNWKVIERVPDRFYPGGGRATMWKCQCKCGTEHIVAGNMLKLGISQSCGCESASVCETHVRTYLSDRGYRYECQKMYPGLLGVGGKQLSYDFLVYLRNRSLCLIECQGEQHYCPIEWFGGEERFVIQQEHDLRKRTYASEHGIPLLEITYKCRTYDDISRFLDNEFNSLGI